MNYGWFRGWVMDDLAEWNDVNWLKNSGWLVVSG